MSEDPRFKNEVPAVDSLQEYLAAYAQRVRDVVCQLSPEHLNAAFALVEGALKSKARIYVAGNGGSAAIADHLCCDWMKGTRVPNQPALRVQSLTSNAALFTALANDFGYETCFSTQIEMLCEPGDVVVVVSSSGNSPNVLAAAKSARARGAKVLGLSGFSGGKLVELSDVSLHVPLNNYGMVEDAHQMLMHVLAQYLAKKRDEAPGTRTGSARRSS